VVERIAVAEAVGTYLVETGAVRTDLGAAAAVVGDHWLAYNALPLEA
jgi:hypothetical protein